MSIARRSSGLRWRGLAIGAAVTLAVAAAAPAARAAPAPPPQALALYPKAALAAGVDGRASVSCDADAHLRRSNCVVVVEDPAGQGFGQAAVALAQMAPGNPKVTTEPMAGRGAEFLFCAHPDFISPDPLEPDHLDLGPIVDRAPTDAEIAQAYPAAAKSAGVSGRVYLICKVGADGAISDCVAHANPAGQGFEAAALGLVPLYHATAETLDGAPVAGWMAKSLLFGPNPPIPAILTRAPPSGACQARAR